MAHIVGVDSTSSNFALKVDNSAGAAMYYVRNDKIHVFNTSSRAIPFSTMEIKATGTSSEIVFLDGSGVSSSNNYGIGGRADWAGTDGYGWALQACGSTNSSAVWASSINLVANGGDLALGIIAASTTKRIRFYIGAGYSSPGTGDVRGNINPSGFWRFGDNTSATHNIETAGTLSVGNYAAFGATSSSSTFAIFGAGTTAKSSLRIVAGVAPTTPVNGDVWQDGTDIKIHIGGITKTFTLL
jgi:hypothetical protein